MTLTRRWYHGGVHLGCDEGEWPRAGEVLVFAGRRYRVESSYRSPLDRDVLIVRVEPEPDRETPP